MGSHRIDLGMEAEIALQFVGGLFAENAFERFSKPARQVVRTFAVRRVLQLLEQVRRLSLGIADRHRFIKRALLQADPLFGQVAAAQDELRQRDEEHDRFGVVDPVTREIAVEELTLQRAGMNKGKEAERGQATPQHRRTHHGGSEAIDFAHDDPSLNEPNVRRPTRTHRECRQTKSRPHR